MIGCVSGTFNNTANIERGRPTLTAEKSPDMRVLCCPTCKLRSTASSTASRSEAPARFRVSAGTCDVSKKRGEKMEVSAGMVIARASSNNLRVVQKVDLPVLFVRSNFYDVLVVEPSSQFLHFRLAQPGDHVVLSGKLSWTRPYLFSRGLSLSLHLSRLP